MVDRLFRAINSDMLSDRLFEWVASIALVTLGLLCAAWSDVIGSSNWRYILLVIGPANLALFLFSVGILRLAALTANGRYWPKWSPRFRAFGALCGALLWFQFAAALLIFTSEVGRAPSPGIPVYLSLMLGELISCYRALAGRHGP